MIPVSLSGRVEPGARTGTSVAASRSLEDGDARVIGAAAVLRHIASGSAPSWLPASPGPGHSWLSSLTSPRFAPRQARPLALFTADGPPPELVEEAAYRLQDMDDHLALAELDGRLWFAGDRPTIVDVAAFGPGRAVQRLWR